MKRNNIRVWLTGSIVLLILILAVSGAAAAKKQSAADPDALQITSIKLSKSSSSLVVRMDLTNQGNDSISEFGVAFAFLDKDSNQLYANPATLDDYMNEVCYWYYTSDDLINPGDTYNTEDDFEAYRNAAAIGVAIRYYCKADGTCITIPESQWLWKISNEDTASELDQRDFYTSPEQSVTEQAQKIDIGYQYYLLDDYNAPYYGFDEGGEWIYEIQIGSIAENAGLEIGDLVLTVDGVKPTENNYAVEYAMVKIASGESVDFTVARDGETLTIALAKIE